LPPYSPDFSPIELLWGWVKSRVRRAGPRDEAAREGEIAQAIESLPPEHAGAWFRKCGYLQC
jgi:transposase